MGTRTKNNALRRYPALAYLAAASALALLLPSGLNVLQSGPTTLAEYAPVPGEGEGSSDVGELGQVASVGVGSGGSGGSGPAGREETAATTTPPEAEAVRSGRLVRRPGTKRCVGDPPRQTEDPLSPPCVAFFEGDNGGATTPGVTKDEVVVFVRLVNGGNTAGDQEEDIVDCAEDVNDGDKFVVQQCKAFMRYFNERYQTYERKVHFYSIGYEVSVKDAIDRLGPFAIAGVAAGSQAAQQVLSVTYTGASRANSLKHAPYLMSFRADVEDQLAQIATYVCDRLEGGKARYAGDPELQDRTRKFGFLFFDRQRKESIKAAVKATCGLEITTESADWDKPTGPAKLLQEGVTTVIIVVGNTGHATASNNATALAYFPEWFVPAASDLNGIDLNFHARVANSAQWRNAFGLTFDIRRAAINEQPWYRAYKEACPDCMEPTTGTGGVLFAAANYESLAMLFYGIQSAGPRLTPENVDKGLHAIPAKASTDPFSPAAYFAPGNYSFVKDAMPIWWDPTGQPPGSSARGCYRLPEEGRRYRAGEWPEGDDLVKAMGPCQADTFQ